jgi:hypothetical protein
MPVITISERDILRSKTVKPAWYRCRVDEAGEKPSKDGGSTNYPMEATLLYNAEDGTKDFEGVPVGWNFNDKAIGFAIDFLKACGEEVGAKGGRFELAAAKHKEIDIFVENDMYQGRMTNRVNHKYRRPVVA